MKNSKKTDFKIRNYKSPEEAAFSLSNEILKISKERVKTKGGCNWALSGGSSILRYYDALSILKPSNLELFKKLRVAWVDERNVPYEHSDSNFGSSYRHFWKNYPEVRLYPVPYFESVEKSARTYNDQIISNKMGKNEIDIIVLGMGIDGHTASIFPYSKTITETKKLITSFSPDDKTHSRITMTFPLINSSDHIYLYVYGVEKGKTFKKIIESNNVQKYPILGVNREKLIIFSDQAFNSI